MQKKAVWLATLIAIIILPRLSYSLTCSELDGAYVFSQESTPVYLGFFGSRYASDSIMNSYGNYGSQYSQLSVRNEFGPYGSPFRTYSANNDFSVSPPKIYKNGQLIAYLTTNDLIANGVSLAVIDSNCSFNSMSPDLPDPKPNLVPYNPYGWGSMVVASTITGTTIDSTLINNNDIIYIDWAVINDSVVNVSSPFIIELSIDYSIEKTWLINNLTAGYYTYFQDFPIGPLSEGTHVIQIKADSLDTIDENDEWDNSYYKIITIESDDALQTYYMDSDGDGYGDPDSAYEFGTPPPGFVADNSDCDDSNDQINPSSPEIPNDGIDQNCDGKDEVIDYPYKVYFPHIASDVTWETEICLINTGSIQTASGTLFVYDNSGNPVSSEMIINLTPNERRQIVIGNQFGNADDIGYAIYTSNSDNIIGYTKFFIPETYRVAVPATSTINTGDIYVSHIASNAEWWTGISLVNTTSVQKTIAIEFNNGQTINKTIAANEHQAFTIASLFGGQSQNALESAVIKNANGIIGLELFGSSATIGNSYLSGILLTDQTATEIYYPHVASNTQWWTGIVAYNPASTDCDLSITTFSEDGTILNISDLTLTAKEKYIGTATDLGFDANTAWFSIVASSPVTGFELFGTQNGQQLGGYTGVGIQRKAGIFAKIEKQGWTGIAFVNTEATSTDITISAYEDDGTLVASESLTLEAYEKMVGMADQLFSQDISDADYIAFVSSNQLVGFQLNGSSDGMMLDALPGM